MNEDPNVLPDLATIEAGKWQPDAQEHRAAIEKLVANAHELVGQNVWLRSVFIDAVLHTKAGSYLYSMGYCNGLADGTLGSRIRGWFGRLIYKVRTS